jgi:hypothetical protein
LHTAGGSEVPISFVKSRQTQNRWQQKLPTVVGHMQTKPFLQRWSVGSFLSPSSPSSQSLFDSQPAVHSDPVPLGSFSAPGSRQMRLGHRSGGDVMVATAPLPPSAETPRSHGRPTCLSSHPPPTATTASANASTAKRDARSSNRGLEGNLMGTPLRPVGVTRAWFSVGANANAPKGGAMLPT